ncbi:ASCH domain-containing protein [Leptolyngbya sp. PL-A3]|uniref:ASCH domain-containing protein n=1 Tax=Leptolyngbya sp. PL-A3 TaxID=2933911 RepID=UPI00329A7C4A
MKLVTLHQPWASLVALGLKRYETRHWSTDYRGPLLIHAAKRPFMSADASRVLNFAAWSVWIDALRIAHETGVINDQSRLPFAHQLPLGCIVAIAELTDCRMMAPSYNTLSEQTYRYINEQSQLELTVGDWRPGRYALQLDNVRPLPQPIPFTSRQGKLLSVPEELALVVRSQIEQPVGVML